MSDADELARQNRALNEQVKLLVRTEKRLYSAQRTIEKQLERIELLNRFALASSRNIEGPAILGLFLDLVLGVLKADQAVALLVDEAGLLVAAADRQLDELPPVPPARGAGVPAGGFAALRPVVLSGADGARTGPVAAVLDLAMAHFDGAVADGGAPHKQPKAEVVIPFHRRDGRLMGVVVLRTLEALHFNDEMPSERDLPFLELASMHLESALENVALLHETALKASLDKELEVARTVQQALVPSVEVVGVGRASFAGFFGPASTCGGDVWTWKQLSADRVLLMIGDVTGHGVPSALIGAVVLGAAELLPPDVTPSGALKLLNQAVFRAGKGQLLMSCFVTVIDVATGELWFANAGHPAPFVVHRAGDQISMASLLGRGSLLGQLEFHQAPDQKIMIAPGDIVVLFSDGITECQNAAGTMWGERRLRRALTQAAQCANDAGAAAVDRVRAELAHAVADFMGATERTDDMTFVVATYN